MSLNKRQSLLQLSLVLGILFFLNIIAQYFYGHLDLTEEKRYSLTTPTRQLLNGLKDGVYVKVLLEGNFPAGFKRLQGATKEMLDDFRSESGYIEYEFEDPSKGTVEQINNRRKELAKDGLIPVNLRVMENGEKKERVIYPAAIVSYGGRSIPVNLLENEVPGRSNEVVLNNSVSLLEYKFANAIQKLKSNNKSNIAFTGGHGELEGLQTADLEKSLRQFYNTGRLFLDSIVTISPEISVLIVAKPRTAFSEKDKFKIDQYVMNGGKVMWLIDRLTASLDSMQRQPNFMPNDYPINLEDILFKYGARIQPNLVLDLDCSKIPLVTGKLGNAPQFELFPWYYSPSVAAISKHPIVKNLDRVSLQFPSSIDTVRTKTPVKKTILLTSSQYSRLQFSPVRLNFEMLRYDADKTKFDKPNQNLAVILEGEFPSMYENRVTDDLTAGLQQLNLAYKAKSIPTKMLVVSDGDIAANEVTNVAEKSYAPLGYNKYEKHLYANKDFLINAIEYLLDDNGVIAARTREVKLRLLDGVSTKSEKTFWQVLNVGVPLLLLLAFGWVFNFLRKRKYGKK
jgi:ABC-2 type transport system permease protein